MLKYTVTNNEYISDKTILLSLKSNSRKSLQHFPGQYAAIGFKHEGRPSLVRCFSIASAPNSDGDLQFGIKVGGFFTKALTKLSPGDEVFVYGPFGNFVIDEELDKNVVLLAGGIGVTPYISMIRYAAAANLKIPITLLYSCQSQESIPFYNELIDLENRNPYFKVLFFVTNGGINKLGAGKIFNSRIEEPQLSKLIGANFNRFTYFVCGPKGFMHAITEILDEHGTDASRIITEEFTPTSQDNVVAASPKYNLTKWTYSLTAATLAIGTFFIMTIDIARALPKLSAQATNSSQSTTSGATSPTTSSDNANNAATSNQQSTSSTSNQSTSNTSNQSNQTQYQSPVTSVS